MGGRKHGRLPEAWQNPTTPSTPSSNSVHQAPLPSDPCHPTPFRVQFSIFDFDSVIIIFSQLSHHTSSQP